LLNNHESSTLVISFILLKFRYLYLSYVCCSLPQGRNSIKLNTPAALLVELNTFNGKKVLWMTHYHFSVLSFQNLSFYDFLSFRWFRFFKLYQAVNFVRVVFVILFSHQLSFMITYEFELSHLVMFQFHYFIQLLNNHESSTLVIFFILLKFRYLYLSYVCCSLPQGKNSLNTVEAENTPKSENEQFLVSFYPEIFIFFTLFGIIDKNLKLFCLNFSR